MKKALLTPILCIFFIAPILVHAQESESCDFNYGTYTEYTPVPVPVFSPAIGLIDGKIYLAGGYDFADLIARDNLQIYDPETDSWDTTGTPLPVPRAIHGGGVTLNGKLYVIGGLDWVKLGDRGWQFVPHARVDAYNPQTDTWESLQNLPIPIGGKAVCNLNGKLYVTGGVSNDQAPLNTLLCYDPGTDQWTELSGMITPRLFHTSVALDGKIYVISGTHLVDGSDATLKCEVYDPDKDQWTSIPRLPTPSILGAACVVDGEIYVFGGSFTGPSVPYEFAYKYNPAMDEWIEIDNTKHGFKGHVIVPIERTIHVFALTCDDCPQSTLAYELSDIILDPMIPNNTTDGQDAIQVDLSEYFSHVDGAEITYSFCLDESGILEASIEGSMLTITGVQSGDSKVSIMAESGEELMGDVFQVHAQMVGIDDRCNMSPSLSIYPNPTRGLTTLSYAVQSAGTVRLEVYDLLGKRVAVPLNEHHMPGEYECQLNTADFSSGIYFCKLITATERVTIKLIVEH